MFEANRAKWRDDRNSSSALFGPVSMLATKEPHLGAVAMSLINVRGSEDVIDTDGVTLRFNPVTLWGVSSAERERLVRNVIIRLLETALSNAYQYRWTDKHYELRALWSDEQWIDLTFKYECAILSMRIAKGHAPLQHLDVLSSVPLAT